MSRENACPACHEEFPSSLGLAEHKCTRTFKVIRIFKDTNEREVLHTGLTLPQAQAHCKDPETSSATCTQPENEMTTRTRGPWFDGYEEE